MNEREQQLEAALRALVERGVGRWISRGYGRSSCSSCGAERFVDYGDQDQPMTEKREPCSRTCPWGIAEALLSGRGTT